MKDSVVVRVKGLDVYSSELLDDLLLDSSGLESGDISFEEQDDIVVNSESEFSRATRVDINTGEYYYTSPFFEKEKFLLEIEVPYLTQLLLFYSLFKTFVWNNRLPTMFSSCEQYRVTPCGFGNSLHATFILSSTELMRINGSIVVTFLQDSRTSSSPEVLEIER